MKEKENKNENENAKKDENINNNNNNNKIKSPKKIIFEEEKIYIKYEEDDYVNKIWIFNQKNEKKNHKKHNRGKYLSRLRKNEKLKSIILNCPIIDYEKIKKKNMLELNNDKNNKENNQQKIKNTKKKKKLIEPLLKKFSVKKNQK